MPYLLVTVLCVVPFLPSSNPPPTSTLQDAPRAQALLEKAVSVAPGNPMVRSHYDHFMAKLKRKQHLTSGAAGAGRRGGAAAAVFDDSDDEAHD